jgi:hypothetical protein
MSGKYFPNNWDAWNDMPEEFLHTPTWEEFEDWKLRGWELPSSVCCIIRVETAKGKIKEYVYQKQHAAEQRIKKLVDEGSSFSICTEDELRHIAPVNSHESD